MGETKKARKKREAAEAAAAAAAGGGGGGEGADGADKGKGVADGDGPAGSASSSAATAGGGAMSEAGSSEGGGGKAHGRGGQGQQAQAQPRVSQQQRLEQQRQKKMAEKQSALFMHLPQHQAVTSARLNVGISSKVLHPATVQTGIKIANEVIVGANSRCVAMLEAFKQLVADYETPPDKTLSRDLESKLKAHIQFLVECRPLSVGMGNAIKHFKVHISKVPISMAQDKAKETLIGKIDQYIEERIVLASQVIAQHGVSKISDGDVILTHGSSSVIETILKLAYDLQINFRVVIADSRPGSEGKQFLARLTKHGIKCTYIQLNALSYIMKSVSKVFVGAAALLHNGCVLSRIGTGTVALVAHAYNVPFIVCCETYKFSERVQTDAFTNNELGDPDTLVKIDRDQGPHLVDWKDVPGLKLLHLKYDITPIDFITMVISEVGMIPPTSCPVVIREYQAAIMQ